VVRPCQLRHQRRAAGLGPRIDCLARSFRSGGLDTVAFGVLVDPAFPGTPSLISDLQTEARTLRSQLVVVSDFRRWPRTPTTISVSLSVHPPVAHMFPTADKLAAQKAGEPLRRSRQFPGGTTPRVQPPYPTHALQQDAHQCGRHKTWQYRQQSDCGSPHSGRSCDRRGAPLAMSTFVCVATSWTFWPEMALFKPREIVRLHRFLALDNRPIVAMGPWRPRHINSERVAQGVVVHRPRHPDCCRLPARHTFKNAPPHALLRLGSRHRGRGAILPWKWPSRSASALPEEEAPQSPAQPRQTPRLPKGRKRPRGPLAVAITIDTVSP
jgi:hypothetical protein